MRAPRTGHVVLLPILIGLGARLYADPVPVKNVVFKPTFETASKPYPAGTAFLCEYPGRKSIVLMTAHHLFGPAGGFPAEIPWDHLNEAIKQTTAVSVDDPGVRVSSKRAILIEGAHASDKTEMQNDIAIFELDSTNVMSALRLAEKSPAPGDRVWLYARQRGGTALELLPAMVVSSTRRELLFGFDQADVHLAGTSGAPVLDADGEVVAINLGGYARGGRRMGFGNPMLSIRYHLQKALKDKP
jgi:hypothetical protein